MKVLISHPLAEEGIEDFKKISQDLKGRSSFFSPTHYRYLVEDLKPYLTEEAFIKYKAKAEAALAKVLAERGFLSWEIANEIIQGTSSITAKEAYEEERKIKHDIHALVNCVRNKVSKEAKPYVHLSATSYDNVDTANALFTLYQYIHFRRKAYGLFYPRGE